MNDYSVFLDTQAPSAGIDIEDQLDQLMDLLAEHSGVVHGDTFGWGAVVSVDASDVHIAHQIGCGEILKHAAKAGLPEWPVVNVRVVRGDVLDEENNRPQLPDLVSGPEAADILGVSSQRVHQLLAEHSDFPAPLYELRTGKVWRRSAIEAFADRWERKPGRPAKKAS